MALGIFGFVSIASLIPFIPFKSKKSKTKKKKKKKDSLIITSISSILVVFMLWWNYNGLDTVNDIPMPKYVRSVIRTIGLNQDWQIFAPGIMIKDGWFYVLGTDKNNKTSIIWPEAEKNKELTDKKPYNIAKRYGNQRWRGYFSFLINGGKPANTVRLLQYMCQKDGDRYESVELIYFMEETQRHPLPPKKPKKISMSKISCQNQK